MQHRFKTKREISKRFDLYKYLCDLSVEMIIFMYLGKKPLLHNCLPINVKLYLLVDLLIWLVREFNIANISIMILRFWIISYKNILVGFEFIYGMNAKKRKMDWTQRITFEKLPRISLKRVGKTIPDPFTALPPTIWQNPWKINAHL